MKAGRKSDKYLSGFDITSNLLGIKKDMGPNIISESTYIITPSNAETSATKNLRSEQESSIALSQSILSKNNTVISGNAEEPGTSVDAALEEFEETCEDIIQADSPALQVTSPISQSSANNIFRRKTKEEINAQIVKNYDEGPSSNLDACVLKYSHSQVDRYGFIFLKDNDSLSIQKLVRESPNIEKWTRIIAHWEKYIKRKKSKLRGYIYNGIPDSMRTQVWTRILDLKTQIDNDPTLYSKLRALGLQKSIEIDQIDKDVERTFRSHVLYNIRYAKKQKELFNILVAYSVYDEKIRYTQGMNELAAVLLMYMSEEEAFWALKTIITDSIHNIHGFYSDNFPKLVIFQDHLDKTVQSKLPRLYNHLREVSFDIPLITTKWFLLCFINSLPFQLVLRIWDIFMLEGITVFYPVAYSLMKYHQSELIKSSLDQLSVFFREGTSKYRYNINEFIENLKENIRKLTKDKLYPIPGVEHDILCIDISSIFTAHETLESKKSETVSIKSEEEQQSHLTFQNSAYSQSVRHLKNVSSFQKNNSIILKQSPLLIDNNFDPSSCIPPKPTELWENYLKRLEENFQYILNKNNINFDNFEIKVISEILKNNQKKSTTNNLPN